MVKEEDLQLPTLTEFFCSFKMGQSLTHEPFLHADLVSALPLELSLQGMELTVTKPHFFCVCSRSSIENGRSLRLLIIFFILTEEVLNDGSTLGLSRCLSLFIIGTSDRILVLGGLFLMRVSLCRLLSR